MCLIESDTLVNVQNKGSNTISSQYFGTWCSIWIIIKATYLCYCVTLQHNFKCILVEKKSTDIIWRWKAVDPSPYVGTTEKSFWSSFVISVLDAIFLCLYKKYKETNCVFFSVSWMNKWSYSWKCEIINLVAWSSWIFV